MPLPWSRRLIGSVVAIGALGAAGVCAATVGVCVAWVRAPARGHIVDEYVLGEPRAPRVPVALVLGAQVYPSGWPSAFLRARLDLAKRLYDAGTVGTILVSGASDAPEYDEPKAMRAYLIAAGVPAVDILVDEHGVDTYDSCVRARDVFGLDEVAIVSQSYHLPRAVGTARRLGLRAYGVGDDSVRSRREPWISGLVRDQLACVKAVRDLISRRPPASEG